MFSEPEQADHPFEAGRWGFWAGPGRGQPPPGAPADTVRRKPSRTANVKERFQP
jgi:hypothetical protein